MTASSRPRPSPAVAEWIPSASAYPSLAFNLISIQFYEVVSSSQGTSIDMMQAINYISNCVQICMVLYALIHLLIYTLIDTPLCIDTIDTFDPLRVKYVHDISLSFS